MALVTEAQRHVDDGLANGLVSLPLVGFAINQQIECRQCGIHDPGAFPRQSKIWIRRKMYQFRAEFVQRRKRFGP
jgi:hypothetical protein